MSLLLMCLVKIHPSNTGKDKKYLQGFSLVALLISAYLIIVIILENIFSFPVSCYAVEFALLVLFLLSPVKVALQAQKDEDSQPIPQVSSNESEMVAQTQRADNSTLDDVRALNVLQAMTKLEFWLLFVAIACGLGSRLATVNNLSQIGQSLGYSTVEINTLGYHYIVYGTV